jgi:Ku protein
LVASPEECSIQTSTHIAPSMTRAIWKGNISFGLVQIPVSLHTAEQRDELSLILLDRRDLGPVGYERVNRRTGAKVDWTDIVKGYPYRKGKYVVVTDEDIRHANVRATGTIDIQAFIEQREISPIYYDTPYYLAPQKQGTKAYAVLRDTLRASGKVGIAKIVLRTRQHLAALRPEDELLILQLLRFSHELRNPGDIESGEIDGKRTKPTPRELEMAKQLVSSMRRSGTQRSTTTRTETTFWRASNGKPRRAKSRTRHRPKTGACRRPPTSSIWSSFSKRVCRTRDTPPERPRTTGQSGEVVRVRRGAERRLHLR